MDIGDRLRCLREQRKLSQGDIEQRTGLFRCYISRVENGHTVPGVETLEKFARALDMRLYQVLYDGSEPPAALTESKNGDGNSTWGSKGKDARLLKQLRDYLSRMNARDRTILLAVVCKMTKRGMRRVTNL
jgi:transcriptional regulator with XRE-family HTH domain